MNNNALQQTLEDVFKELIVANEKIPIIVEGKNDEAALRSLGVSGVVIRLNTGLSILNFCEDVAKQYNEVILLPDWDDKGKQLLEKLQHHFKYTPARVNDRFWHDLKRICSREIVEVEQLTKFINN